jgi:undecaprenyl-phosphate 4-deoxy-4-formamido-L-arabinose transferase
MTKYSLSVVIPVYNSMNILLKLFERLCPVLEFHTVQAEVIFVNDCSDDGSWEVICGLAEKHDWVRGINLMRNYGQHNALLRGIRAARHELIITMDDDLQNLPEEIPKLLAKLSEKYDVVYGSPGKRQHGFWRNLATRVTKLALQNIMGASTARESSTFRLFRTSLRKSFANYTNRFVSIDVLLTWGTTRFASVPVRDGPRMAGESNYSFGKLIVHALNTLGSAFCLFSLRAY